MKHLPKTLISLALITARRVFLYRFDRQPTEGFASGSLTGGSLEVITTGGSLQSLELSEIKALCFISDGGGKADLFTIDSLFERRPKLPGLWARFTFRDGERLEGVMPHNLLEWPESGYMLVPPKASSSRQRVFVPRSALLRTECLGVVGKLATAAKARTCARDSAEQLAMFESIP